MQARNRHMQFVCCTNVQQMPEIPRQPGIMNCCQKFKMRYRFVVQLYNKMKKNLAGF
jgi:hypothetical protein